MRKRTKIILGIVTAVLLPSALFGWWMLDRTIIARNSLQKAYDANSAGDYQIAEEQFSRSLRKLSKADGRYGHAVLFRGINRFRLQKYTEAIDDINTSLPFLYDHHLALAYRGASFYKLGQLNEAEKDLDGALERSNKSVLANYWRGVVAERKSDYELALEHYRAAIEKNHAFAKGYAAMSRIHRARGEKPVEEKCIEIAKEIDPNVSFEIE